MHKLIFTEPTLYLVQQFHHFLEIEIKCQLNTSTTISLRLIPFLTDSLFKVVESCGVYITLRVVYHSSFSGIKMNLNRLEFFTILQKFYLIYNFVRISAKLKTKFNGIFWPISADFNC